MDLVGYTNRLDVEPAQTIQFMVSSNVGPFDVEMVQLIHGDQNPAGPGFKSRVVSPSLHRGLEGEHYTLPKGSFLACQRHVSFDIHAGFSVSAFVYPMHTCPGRQAIVSLGPGRDGFALTITEDNCVHFSGPAGSIQTDRPMRVRAWHHVGATIGPDGLAVWQIPVLVDPLRPEPEWRSVAAVGPPALLSGEHLVLGAMSDEKEATPEQAHSHLNGKLATPRLYARQFSLDEVWALTFTDAAPEDDTLLAAWHFEHNIEDVLVTDRSPNALHATCVNAPLRGVTSWRYSGGGGRPSEAPAEYDAIAFHADDLEDARWPVSFEYSVPESFRSGVYAAHIVAQDGTAEDYIPFFVSPPAGVASADIAVLFPTYSYLAYANEHYTLVNPASPVSHSVNDYLQPEDVYAADAELLSLYDYHRDGTGAAIASLLRPLVNVRPRYHMPLLRGPHQFPADLCLADWLTTKGFEFDALTDHKLHAEGVSLLERYRVVITGSHPEYWTASMWRAMRAYLDQGGRVMYLGGNGMYWVISTVPERPHLIEIRRGHGGTGAWRSEPGEEYSALTGERGGLWRHRGLTPQSLFGVGMTAAGYDVALPFRRLPDSHDPRAAFIFAGVPDDAVIGDDGLVMGGAAGLEIDRADTHLGTPPHALVVASAQGFSDSYQAVVEEVTHSDSRQGGTVNPQVRADMVFFEGPAEGAVFSVGSITWTACLSMNHYENWASVITRNVLSTFLDSSWSPTKSQMREGD